MRRSRPPTALSEKNAVELWLRTPDAQVAVPRGGPRQPGGGFFRRFVKACRSKSAAGRSAGRPVGGRGRAVGTVFFFTVNKAEKKKARGFISANFRKIHQNDAADCFPAIIADCFSGFTTAGLP